MLRASVNDPSKGEAAHRARLEKLLKKLWRESADAMVTHVFGKKQKALLSSFEPTVGVNNIMTDFVSTYGLDKAKQLARTTTDRLRQIINTGIDEGLGERDVAKLIRERTPSIAASRAQTIARTETHAAANFAVMESAKSTGVEMRKEWVSATDERTREAHADANGQIVALDEPFNVGGDDLMYPGDPSGSGENVINCRCAMVYVF